MKNPLLIVVCVVLGGVQSTRAQNGPAENFSSVVVKYADDRAAFSSLMQKLVSPKMTKIRDSFGKNIAEAEALLIEHRKHPKSKEIAAKYEEKLSQALTEVSQYLEEFSDSEEETLQALDTSIGSARAAVQAFRAGAVQTRKDAEEFLDEAKQVDGTLARIAKKFADRLKSDNPLPAEIDVEIRKLKTTMTLSRQNGEFTARSAALAEKEASQIASRLEALQRMRGTLEVSYHTSRGQILSIANVSRLRGAQLSRQKLFRQINDATKDLEKYTLHADEIDDKFKPFLMDPGTMPSLNVGDAASKKPQASKEILRAYLLVNDKPQAKKEMP